MTREQSLQVVEIHLWIKTSFSFLEYKIYQAVKSYGFKQNVDKAYVYKHFKDKKVVFLVLYINDILLIKNVTGVLILVKV